MRGALQRPQPAPRLKPPSASPPRSSAAFSCLHSRQNVAGAARLHLSTPPRTCSPAHTASWNQPTRDPSRIEQFGPNPSTNFGRLRPPFLFRRLGRRHHAAGRFSSREHVRDGACTAAISDEPNPAAEERALDAALRSRGRPRWHVPAPGSSGDYQQQIRLRGLDGPRPAFRRRRHRNRLSAPRFVAASG